MFKETVRYVRLMVRLSDNRVIYSEGNRGDIEGIHGLSEIEALNRLGEDNFRIYMIREKEEAVNGEQKAYRHLWLANQPLNLG